MSMVRSGTRAVFRSRMACSVAVSQPTISRVGSALGGEIDTLEQQHEGLCAGTARLRKMVAAAEGGYKPLDLGLARTLVQESQQLLLTHNDREVRVFLDAFHGMDEAGRQLLAKDLNRL